MNNDELTLKLPRSVAIALLRQLEEQLRPEAEPMKISLQDPDLLKLPLEQLPFVCKGRQLRGRVRSFLEHADTWHGIKTIEDLCRMSPNNFLKFKNIGDTIKQVVDKALEAKGLKFGMSDAEIEYYHRGW